MRRFLPYLRFLKPVRWHFAGGILAGLVYAAASGLGLPTAIKVLFPLVFEGENEESERSWFFEFTHALLGNLEENQIVLLGCLWLPFIFLIRALGGYFNSYLITLCGYRVIEGLQLCVFERLQQLPVAFFQRFQSGDLLARVTGDTEAVRQVVAQASSEIIKQPATLLFALSYLVFEATRNDGSFVVLIAILTIPACIIPIRHVGKKLGQKAREAQNAAGELSGLVSESLQSPLEIRAYNLQRSHVTKLRTKIRNLVRFSMKVVKYRQMVSPAIEVVAATGLALAFYLGVQQGMTLESFTAIGVALFISYEPAKKLGGIHVLFRQGAAALDRIEAILHAEEEVPESGRPKTPDLVRGEIHFRNISFSYRQDPILQNINLKIAAGECVALIGHTGSGKSTIANLIPRFFDVTQGTVEVDGVDVRDWRKSELRSQIAVVSQTPVLFSGTILDNILLGRPGSSRREAEAAARDAHAHEFILEQPEGYDQMVAERGSTLSGGQRQRIVLARAFLKNAPILILDEATSALDRESEAHVQEALQQLMKDRTTIIIAHRLSTTRIANRVLEIDHGRLVAEKKATQLLETPS